jgi:hypothetical protein
MYLYQAREAMLLRTFECALAGNLFDAGAAAAVAEMAFCDVDDQGEVRTSNIDVTVANRASRVWHGATGNGPRTKHTARTFASFV